MIRKTIGGDRLGSGSKMKIDMHGYERSTHDLSYLWRSTMAPGTLVPFMSKIALPGDTWDINLNTEVLTHPTVGPLFGSYKVQLDVFQAPIRLYNAFLHNNALGIGLKMDKVLLPQLILDSLQISDPSTIEDIDNCQINPSCILSYLGIRGIGINTSAPFATRKFNAVSWLAYWEIYKQYYSNKQEEIGAVIHTDITAIIETVDDIQNGDGLTPSLNIPQAPISNAPTSWTLGRTFQITFTGTTPKPNQIILNTVEWGDVSIDNLSTGIWSNPGSGQLTAPFRQTYWGDITVINWRYATATDLNTGKPGISTFDLANIDDMRNSILAWQSETIPFTIGDDNLPPYGLVLGENDLTINTLSTQEGLGLKTYQSDLFNNWLNTEWIDGDNGISAITAIDTTGGSFTIDTLNLSKKVYDMLNRIAMSGGTYNDWIEVNYDHQKYILCESPMYCGGLIKELAFQEVVSNSASTDQPLGTLAGKGKLTGKHKGGHVVIKVDEPSYILGIVSITPRLDYSQGNSWDVNLKSLDDLHKPALDEIGFQELITEQMAWWDTTYNNGSGLWEQKSAGKQPAWLNYMTSVNETRGNFAISSNEMFMTLNRRYERDNDGIKDLTTYIDPSKFNFIFAETAIDAQNFWVQIGLDITTRRKMSARLMPNL